MTTEIKRIVPEEVVEIFEKLNLKPTEGRYFDENKTCACAIGAMYLNENPESIDKISTFETVASLGYTDDYLAGIISGFDNDKNINEVPLEYGLGYDDGQKVRNLLLEKGYKMLYLGREKS